MQRGIPQKAYLRKGKTLLKKLDIGAIILTPCYLLSMSAEMGEDSLTRDEKAKSHAL
jgi:hypothetical protein